MKIAQLNELLYQSLETEIGGVQIYTTALGCAINQETKGGVAKVFGAD